MKRTIGLMALMMTAVAAFAQPAAAWGRPVIVERRPVVVRHIEHHPVRVIEVRRDPYCRH